MTEPAGMTAKREALARFAAEYAATEARIGSLSASALARPVFGEGTGWRVKDLAAHWALWQRVAARVAEKIAAGTPWPAEGGNLRQFAGIAETLDELNDERYREFRDRAPEHGLAELRAAHAALMAALERLPEDAILDPAGPEGIRRHFWQPGINHLRFHREHIDAALKEGATTA